MLLHTPNRDRSRNMKPLRCCTLHSVEYEHQRMMDSGVPVQVVLSKLIVDDRSEDDAVEGQQKSVQQDDHNS